MIFYGVNKFYHIFYDFSRGGYFFLLDGSITEAVEPVFAPVKLIGKSGPADGQAG